MILGALAAFFCMACCGTTLVLVICGILHSLQKCNRVAQEVTEQRQRDQAWLASLDLDAARVYLSYSDKLRLDDIIRSVHGLWGPVISERDRQWVEQLVQEGAVREC